MNLKKKWFKEKVQCVILCAGAGQRMQPESLTKPKVLSEVDNKPLLDFVIDFWRDYVSEFIMVVGYKKEMIYAYADSRRLNCRFVEQKELKGIAHALSLCEDIIDDHHILQLGDCIMRGTFNFPDLMKNGVGVWETENNEDIHRSYSVEIQDELIFRVKEKPEILPNKLCGMGTYFFNRNVFDAIRKTPPSALRGEQEITDVLQTLIDSGETLSPIVFNGQYINVTYPDDLLRVKEMFS